MQDSRKREPAESLYQEYHERREKAGVHEIEAAGGKRYSLYRYADVASAFKDIRFGAAPASPWILRALRWSGLGFLAQVVEKGLLIALNPPEHTRLRKIIEPFFTGRAVDQMKSRVCEQVEALLAPVLPGQEVDLIAQFAAPLPTRIIAELIGFPPSDFERLKRWSDDLAPLIDSDLQRSALPRRIRAFLGFRRRVKEIIQERWRDPQEDLLTALAKAHYGEQRLTEAEVVGTAIFVLTAGHATTAHLIGSCLNVLLDRPDIARQLRDDLRLVDRLIEETLRLESPLQRTGRVLLEDVVIEGRRIPRGAKIRLVMGSANRDPRRFSHPEQFDLMRADNRHLGFGSGIHQCVGLQLTRLEARIAIGELLQRFSTFERVEPQRHWIPGTKFRGLTHLKVKVFHSPAFQDQRVLIPTR